MTVHWAVEPVVNYFLRLMLSASRFWFAQSLVTPSSAHPPSNSIGGGAVFTARGGRFTRAKMPTFLSLMKLMTTIGHEGCEGRTS